MKTSRLAGAVLFLTTLATPAAPGEFPRLCCLTVDPGSPTTIFVGAFQTYEVPTLPPPLTYTALRGALFATTDEGENWERRDSGIELRGVGNLAITSLAIDQQNPATLFTTAAYNAHAFSNKAPTIGAVFRSNDGGNTWQNVLDAGNEPTTAMIDPVDSSTVYASALTSVSVGGLYKTIDGGQTWVDLTADLDLSIRATVTLLAIDPRDHTILYASTANSLLKSTDGGIRWSGVSGGLPFVPASLAIDPSDSLTLYAGGADGEVFKSEDGGESWLSSRVGLSGGSINSLLVLPNSSLTVYAATSRGLFKSTNAAESWEQTGLNAGSDVVSIAVSPNPPVLFASTGSDGIFRSTDFGLSWRAINGGIGLGRGGVLLAPLAPRSAAPMPPGRRTAP